MSDTAAILAIEAILAFLRLGATEQAERYAESALEELRSASGPEATDRSRALAAKRSKEYRERRKTPDTIPAEPVESDSREQQGDSG